MKSFLKNCILLGILIIANQITCLANQNKPIVDNQIIFDENNGVVAVEAEHFYKQSLTDTRQWYITSAKNKPTGMQDPDETHISNASNFAYIELLPDTRVTHGNKLIAGENFEGSAGKMAVLHYKVYINNPGRYYVWVRAYSTGTEDNGIHVGIDGTWPEHGKRMQWTAKRNWHWDCKQRTDKVHVGVPMEIYLDIDKPGEHEITFSMREDGFEMDKFMLVSDKNFRPKQDKGPEVKVKTGTLPKPFPQEKVDFVAQTYPENVAIALSGTKVLEAIKFPKEGTGFYMDKKKWLAIHPEKNKEATTSINFPFASGVYDLLFLAVGENDGKSTYKVTINDEEIFTFTCPLSNASFEEGPKYNDLWENITVNKGDKITVWAKIGSEDTEYSRGRWSGIAFAPMTKGKDLLKRLKNPEKINQPEKKIIEPKMPFSDPSARGDDGNGKVKISGELKRWHKVTLTMDGPFAHELDNEPNPFTDYNMMVTFTHESGTPSYLIPGYFAANGNAAETSSDSGNKWRAHLSPDKIGNWNYKISFIKGEMAAIMETPWSKELTPFHGVEGSFQVTESDKTGRDFRAKGRLEYVGKHHLQFKGSAEYFMKAGTDAPETFLAYTEFDGTYTMKVPLKKYESHLKDWNNGDPTWQSGKGKAIIGSLNYLSEKKINAFSFLTYAGGGDGDNVWPFIRRDDKYKYDCSKLDQWQIVFDHAQSKGLFCHFKTQETENDDNNRGKNKKLKVLTSLDGGDLGPQRRLYYRELIARFSYLLALNWNMGEENTQSLQQRKAMIAHMRNICPYNQHIVLHTYPNAQKSVYPPLLGEQSKLTGVSLQNDWKQVHKRTLQWVKASAETKTPWVVANDEQGSAGAGVPPDHGYKGYDKKQAGYDEHDVRRQVLWGNFMAGGAGVEYYFGYKLPENDLLLEDYRSRDRSWDYCKVGIEFFKNHNIPFWEMKNQNQLIGNTEDNNDKYCLAKDGEVYLVFLGYVPTSKLDLSAEEGNFTISWFNPRTGGKLKKGSVKKAKGGTIVELGEAPMEKDQDWLVIVRKK